jgi:hypothetical protein
MAEKLLDGQALFRLIDKGLLDETHRIFAEFFIFLFPIFQSHLNFDATGIL